MNITRLAIQRPIASAVIAVAMAVMGIYSLLLLPVNFLPDITYPLIKVYIYSNGATPDEIVTNIAEPLERQMATVDGLDYLESSSIEGMYSLNANFRYGVDINIAYQDALAAMARVARQLPKNIEPPIIIKADPSQLPVIQVTVASDQWDQVRLRTWAEKWFQDQIIAVSGVAGTDIAGGMKREIRIHLDPAGLEKFGLTLPTVIKRLQDENIEQFGGRVTSGRREFIARTVGEFHSLQDMRELILVTGSSGTVRLGDIAQIEDGHEEMRVVARLDGVATVKVSVLKQADANTVDVAQAVAKRLDELRPSLPTGITLGIIENQADYVIASLSGVRNAALEAAALIILVVFLFLGSWRPVLIMMLALPLTLIVNFALMKLGGFSLNIFSLGGLVVAIGVVLDNSIVVVENISRQVGANRHDTLAAITRHATAEVAPAIVAATLAFLAVFLPFLLVPGLTSLLFKELVLTVSGIVIISLLLAVSFTPMLASLLIKRTDAAEGGRFDLAFGRFRGMYARWVAVGVQRKGGVLSIFVLLVVGAGYLAMHLGGEFLPAMDDGRVMVKVRLPTGTAVGQTAAILESLEQKIAGDPRIESYFTLGGGKVIGLYTIESANEGEIDIQLVPRHQREISTKAYIEQLRPLVAQVPVPGGKIIVAQQKIKGLRKIGDADIELKIKGDDVNALFRIARETVGRMEQLKHFNNIYVSLDLNKPEYQVVVDRRRAAALGMSVSEVANALQSMVAGSVATRYRDGEDYYNIRVIVPEQRITSRADIEALIIGRSHGGFLRLADIATVEQAVGPVEILREDQAKEVIVRGDAAGVSVSQALAELQDKLKTLDLPPGYELTYGGQAQMMAEMARTTMLVMAFAFFFAFVVLAVQFNSLRLPLLVLAAIPVSLAGAGAGLYIANIPLGATVAIGVLVVIALTINKSVLLLTFAEDLVKQGIAPAQAAVEAARVRLRPELMLSLCFIVGLIPLALNLEEGGDMLQPMAVAAIGGLIMATLASALLTPCLYALLSGHPDQTATPILATKEGVDHA